MKSISVVIIENETICRLGVATILSETGKIHVCGLAKYGKEGLEIVDREQPDVVVVNLDLPDVSGIDVISTIKQRHQSIKIVVMTAICDRDTVNAAISHGADCYYCRNSVREEVGERLVEAVMAASNNKSWIDPTIHHILIESFRSKDSYENNRLDLLSEFSKREITVLKLTAEGIKNDEIANRMYVSEGTVRSYMHSLFTKLGVNDKLNAVRKGIHIGILTFKDMKVEQEMTQPTRKKVKPNRKSQDNRTKASYEGEKGWAM
ncbi:MAG: response regulator transcription factor [Scytonema sp. PMC 1069.18]|nr:response regulator transcription factor [Scytonema sp. PMC 1069.18]MEC4880956.1 response regulator transcription factor [Scytonema sp. PMC 1070.18]